MKISFCTTCMDRSSQLRLTLPINLNLVNKYPNTELVICNFSSRDDFSEVVREVINDFKLDTSKLKIVTVYDQQFFQHSKAKNIAHKNASGDVLVNLDVDNFLTTGFIDFITVLFENNINSVTDGNVEGCNGGVYGRICISKENFYTLGGYWEGLDGNYGEEDPDLVRRAVKFLGSQHVSIPEKFLMTIHHSDGLRVENLEHPVFNIAGNKRASENSIKKGVVNPNGDLWGVY